MVYIQKLLFAQFFFKSKIKSLFKNILKFHLYPNIPCSSHLSSTSQTIRCFSGQTWACFSIRQQGKTLLLQSHLQPFMIQFLISLSLDAVTVISLQYNHVLASCHNMMSYLWPPPCLIILAQSAEHNGGTQIMFVA